MKNKKTLQLEKKVDDQIKKLDGKIKSHHIELKSSKSKLTKKATRSSTSIERVDHGYFKKGIVPVGATPWKPGQSGNPNGRPPKSAMDEALEDCLKELIPDFDMSATKKKRKHGRPRKDTAAKVLARKVIWQALVGKRGIAQLIFERVGGKPLQQIDAKVEQITQLNPEQRKARIRELLIKAERTSTIEG
jgi:uncharacterized protein DUF5681